MFGETKLFVSSSEDYSVQAAQLRSDEGRSEVSGAECNQDQANQTRQWTSKYGNSFL